MKLKSQRNIFILLGIAPLILLFNPTIKENFGVIGQIILINTSVFIKGIYDKIKTQKFSIFLWLSIIIFILVIFLFVAVILLIPKQN